MQARGAESANRKKPSAGERRRAAIVDAARTLFIARGFDGTSLDDVIARAGGSKATIYQQFGSKEGLFAAIVADVAQRILAPAPASRTSAYGTRATLLQMAHAACALVLHPLTIDLYRLAVGESRRFPDLGRAFWESGPARAQGGFADWLRQQRAAGVLRVPDPELAASFFFGMLLDRHTLSMSLGVSGPPTRQEIDKRVHEAVDAFLAAYQVARKRD